MSPTSCHRPEGTVLVAPVTCPPQGTFPDPRAERLTLAPPRHACSGLWGHVERPRGRRLHPTLPFTGCSAPRPGLPASLLSQGPMAQFTLTSIPHSVPALQVLCPCQYRSPRVVVAHPPRVPSPVQPSRFHPCPQLLSPLTCRYLPLPDAGPHDPGVHPPPGARAGPSVRGLGVGGSLRQPGGLPSFQGLRPVDPLTPHEDH